MNAAAAKITPSSWWPVNAGATYNAMIFPLINLNIAGAIWYQGEGNTGTAGTYSKILTTMIDSWRKAWKKDIPFYYVQIAPFKYGNNNVGALVREQQTLTLKHPKTVMVVITDLVDDINNIHPNNKLPVAMRLANWALADNYSLQHIYYKNPLYNHMEIKKDKASLYFDNAPNGFMISGIGKASEFYVAGEDQQFYPADVKIERDRIIVSAKQVKLPVAVRFSFTNTAISNVFSKEGLPLAPFRTDNWSVNTDKIP